MKNAIYTLRPEFITSFVIINKRKDMLSFMKYINNHAAKDSIIVVEGKIN